MAMPTHYSETDPFPRDWEDWERVWGWWHSKHLTNRDRSTYRWPEPNFMADEVIWQGVLNGRDVELSAVTFMEDRLVGITFANRSPTPNGRSPLRRASPPSQHHQASQPSWTLSLSDAHSPNGCTTSPRRMQWTTPATRCRPLHPPDSRLVTQHVPASNNAAHSTTSHGLTAPPPQPNRPRG